MSWQGILGHDKIVRRFQLAASRNRLAGSFLFVGMNGIGKRTFVVALAKTILCQNRNDEKFEPCGSCDSCRLFPAAGQLGVRDEKTGEMRITHPDFHAISKPPDKSRLPLELIVGDKEHRGRSGLCFEISRSPYFGGKKIALIDDADFFNAEVANALLKTLEEPPNNSLMILLGSSTAKQLPTIRSRCQVVRFQSLSTSDVATVLKQQRIVDSDEQSLLIAKRADGSIETACEMMDDSLEVVREDVMKLLNVKRVNTIAAAATVNRAVDAVGKDDAPKKRQRLRFILKCAIEFYENQLRSHANTNEEQARRDVRNIERIMTTIEQVDSNGNLKFVVEAMFNELSV